MASQIERIAGELRGQIVSGQLLPGQRIFEVDFAAAFKVSRTPLRLALSELEKEGLLERRSSRGYSVKTFSVDEIIGAVEVRGALEGLAARVAAERGLSAAHHAALAQSVADGAVFMAQVRASTLFGESLERWRSINLVFHRTVLDACGNPALSAAVAHNNRIPFAGPGAIALPAVPTEIDVQSMRRAFSDHEDLFSALVNRQPVRAESIMREHAYRSGEAKRRSIEALAASGLLRKAA
ncbi:GntR family transcriptional regulator [Ramlibacter sp.]|uniref:GntR family transcriptional regulator n=1 Tax=Ramlibacter sp. TaxID=1917967 RepID=UPI003D127897